MRLCNQGRQVEAEAGPTRTPGTRRIAAVKRFAEMRCLIVGEPRTVVGNPKHQLFAFDPTGQPDGAIFRPAVPDRIAQQVLE